MCCRCCSEKQRKIWVFGSGALIGVIAIILLGGWPTWGVEILESELSIREGSMMYDNWITTPVPIHLTFYMWNWTNSDKFADHTVKPHFQECGPYVFEQGQKRINLTWNKNYTVSFNQIRIWKFNEKLSKGRLDDIITTINPITATVANMMKDQANLLKEVINFLLNTKGGSLTRTETVQNWIFDGYEDELLTFIKKFNSSALEIPFTKFGWYVDRNNSATSGGRITMNTGVDNIKKLGLITRWKGKNHTGFFDGSCGNIHGTSGELWPARMDPVAPISVFVADICRSVTVKYHDKFELHGIEGSQWMGDDSIFDNGHLYDENRCFCPAEKFEDCPPTGILDVSKCQMGAPAAMSYPHFYMADPSYLAGVDGLSPNHSLHKFVIALEPSTGLPLNLAARVQLNLHSLQDDKLDILKNSQKVLMPVFWFAQGVTISEDLAGTIKLAMAVPDIGLYISYGLLGVAAILICTGVILTLTDSWGGRTTKDKKDVENEKCDPPPKNLN